MKHEQALRAFRGDPRIKAQTLSQVRAQPQNCKLYSTLGGRRTRRASAVALTTLGKGLDAYEGELGIPTLLANIEEAIFKNLPPSEAAAWPERFLQAASVGADLSRVWLRLAIWILSDPECGTMKHCGEEGREATEGLLRLFETELSGKKVAKSRWAASYAKIQNSEAGLSRPTDAAIALAAWAIDRDVGDASGWAQTAIDFAASTVAIHEPGLTATNKWRRLKRHYVAIGERLLRLMRDAR